MEHAIFLSTLTFKLSCETYGPQNLCVAFKLLHCLHLSMQFRL